jgi:hypothetical protein
VNLSLGAPSIALGSTDLLTQINLPQKFIATYAVLRSHRPAKEVFWERDVLDGLSSAGAIRIAVSLFIPILGDVSHNIFDGINPIRFAKVARGVVTLIENCAEPRRSFSGCLKRPDRGPPDPYKALTVVYAVNEEE